MLIRRLTPEDEPFLWKALYYAIHVPPGDTPPPPEVVREPDLACYVVGWMRRPDDLGFGVEEEGALIGAAWLRRWADQERGYGFVDTSTPELSIALLPGHRGHGVGTRLLRCLLSAASDRFAAVSLSVSMSNPARRLYAREGFEVVVEVAGDSVTMVRQLSGGGAA